MRLISTILVLIAIKSVQSSPLIVRNFANGMETNLFNRRVVLQSKKMMIIEGDMIAIEEYYKALGRSKFVSISYTFNEQELKLNMLVGLHPDSLNETQARKLSYLLLDFISQNKEHGRMAEANINHIKHGQVGISIYFPLGLDDDSIKEILLNLGQSLDIFMFENLIGPTSIEARLLDLKAKKNPKKQTQNVYNHNDLY